MLEFFDVLNGQNPRFSKPYTIHFPKPHFHQLRKFDRQMWPKIYLNIMFQILRGL